MSGVERTLFCGNISEKVTEDILYELFLQAGPLESVKIPKDKDGKQRNFGFVTFKHAVSVPYSVALMNGVSLYGKPLSLAPRTGAESEHNPFLEKLMNYKKTMAYQDSINRNYGCSQRETYEDASHRYDSRRYESPRTDYNTRNAYPGITSQPYNTGVPIYANQMQNQARFIQNSLSQVAYPTRYGNQMPWSRNQR